MASLSLSKRKAGAPLTEAERQQRQDAARARWGAGKAVAATAGAAAGLSVGQAVIQQRHAAGLQRILAASDAALKPEEARHAGKDARIVLNGLRAKALVNGKWPVPAMRAYLSQQKRNAAGELKTAQAAIDPYEAHRKLVLDSLRGTEPADFHQSIDIRQFQRERSRHAPIETVADASRPVKDIAAAQARIDELADARKSGTVARAGRSYTLTPHTRKIKVGRELREKYLPQLAAAQAAADEAGEEFRPPKSWYRSVVKVIEVKPKNQPSETGKHRIRVKGTPDAKGIRSIRTELTGAIEAHTNVHRAAEEARHAGNMAAARNTAAQSIDQALHWIPNRRFKLAALAGGAAAGALLGLGAASAAQQRLGKAAGDTSSEDETTGDLPAGPAELSEAVDNAEPKLAQALARVFRQWKDDATANLLTPRESTLYSTMLTDMDRATRPLESVLQSGADAPVSAVAPDADGGAKIITLTTGARGPDVEKFIADYRRDRIVQLAQEQREAIRDLLIDAAREGSSPQEMARRIRQTIGLTATQGQSVLNYRRELEQNKPAALQRALRDTRYDSLVQRTQDENGLLSNAQIDRIVDAYHRKYLAYRAMVISRTEGVGAANNAHMAVTRAVLAKNPRFTVIKTWHAKIDGHERHDHHELDGQSVVGIDTPFRCDSGDTILYPHDPAAKARQVVQCRCYVSYRLILRDLAAQMGTAGVKPFGKEMA